jgi:hypothetical protein
LDKARLHEGLLKSRTRALPAKRTAPKIVSAARPKLARAVVMWGTGLGFARGKTGKDFSANKLALAQNIRPAIAVDLSVSTFSDGTDPDRR